LRGESGPNSSRYWRRTSGQAAVDDSDRSGVVHPAQPLAAGCFGIAGRIPHCALPSASSILPFRYVMMA
jgi:hypothetical protein